MSRMLDVPGRSCSFYTGFRPGTTCQGKKEGSSRAWLASTWRLTNPSNSTGACGRTCGGVCSIATRWSRRESSSTSPSLRGSPQRRGEKDRSWRRTRGAVVIAAEGIATEDQRVSTRARKAKQMPSAKEPSPRRKVRLAREEPASAHRPPLKEASLRQRRPQEPKEHLGKATTATATTAISVDILKEETGNGLATGASCRHTFPPTGAKAVRSPAQDTRSTSPFKIGHRSRPSARLQRTWVRSVGSDCRIHQ
mmetsp:Transcript_46056/g.109483  ORF Transcript_46056/g.109483 Transcript_46056/m.109483 type:complete len:252 (-) Transcript_46056:14-769(-)